jgi:MFS superfamily sulfate permease-like transporter
VLNLIPKAALAAILIYTGYKLCKPAMFRHMWKGGMTQFIPFIATVVGVVSLDLLKGVGLGIIISIIYILRQNARISFYYQRSVFTKDDLIRLQLAQEVSFLNKASIKETLNNIPEGSTVIIDATETEYIDFDVLEIIKDFCNSRAADKNIKMSLIGFKNSYGLPASSTGRQIIEHLINNDEVPKRTSGRSYKKLLTQLKKPK